MFTIAFILALIALVLLVAHLIRPNGTVGILAAVSLVLALVLQLALTTGPIFTLH